MKLLTELQILCHLEQMDGARHHFHQQWAPVAASLEQAGLTHKEIAAYEIAEWQEWLKAHGLHEH